MSRLVRCIIFVVFLAPLFWVVISENSKGIVLLAWVAIAVLIFWLVASGDKYYAWQETTHVPRWVRREANKIVSTQSEISDSSPIRVYKLGGTMFNYRITYRMSDRQLLKIERKRRKYNRRNHAWEDS